MQGRLHTLTLNNSRDIIIKWCTPHPLFVFACGVCEHVRCLCVCACGACACVCECGAGVCLCGVCVHVHVV